MAVYVARRLLVSALTLLASSFLVYVLVTAAGDPLADLRTDTGPDRAVRIAARSRELHLDEPVPRRYLTWLQGVGRCVVPGGGCNLGTNQRGQDVGVLLGQAAVSTLRLILAAAVIAVLLGTAVGVLAALRRGTWFDRAVTGGAFVLVSLPVFWLAVVAKQYVAISVNDWYADPHVPLPAALAVGLVVGAVAVALVPGDRRRRPLVGTAATAVTAALLEYLSLIGWFGAPALGPLLVLLLSVAAALGVAVLLGGPRRAPRAALACVVTALVGSAVQFPVTAWLTGPSASWPALAALAGVAAAAAVLIGTGLGGGERSAAVGGSLATAAAVVLLLGLDALLRAVPGYAALVGGRILPTVGSQTPDLRGTFWQQQLDVAAHLLLPTLCLVLVSAAPYSRYVRAGLLEVLGQDYVRTARAKGASRVAVVLRHALRSALVPVTTLAALDFGGLIGGAVITESVFGWQGMGSLFINGLLQADPPPVMAFYLVTGASVAVFNLFADVAYAALDPRVRVS